jgi:hypothetical protein
MNSFTTTFSIPDWINNGLKSGIYVRFGGVIRDVRTKNIVAMLREVSPSLSQVPTVLSQVGSVASILNLAISVIGFALLMKRLGKIEHRLKAVQDDIKQLHHKFDLSVYANFRAALDLARDSLTMTRSENRLSMAQLAINRFLEVQHIYTNYFDTAIEQNVEVANEYLLSLFLTYVARSRCYLELQENKTAISCLEEGAEALKNHTFKYLERVHPYIQQDEWIDISERFPLLLSKPQSYPPGTLLSINGVITGVMNIGNFSVGSSTQGIPVAAASIAKSITLLDFLNLFSGNNSKKEEKLQFPALP